MKYVIIGNGRVGPAFAAYCRHLRHEALVWSRAEVERLPAMLLSSFQDADVLAIATPDAAIEQVWITLRPYFDGKHAIHFSGALSIAGTISCHPLYSFPKTTLAPEKFATLAIAVEEGQPTFADVVPGANNPSLVVNAADRAYYHSLAVISGNYAAHIWNTVAARFERKFTTDPAEVFAPYFQSVVERFRESPLSSVTGPIARRDVATVEANLEAIEGEIELE